MAERTREERAQAAQEQPKRIGPWRIEDPKSRKKRTDARTFDSFDRLERERGRW